MTDEELTYPKKAKRKRGANVAEQEQSKHRKRSPRNNIRINQSAQPANEQQVEGSHSASLQPPCRKENLNGSSVKRNQRAKRKVKKPHQLHHLNHLQEVPQTMDDAKHIVALFCISHALFWRFPTIRKLFGPAVNLLIHPACHRSWDITGLQNGLYIIAFSRKSKVKARLVRGARHAKREGREKLELRTLRLQTANYFTLSSATRDQLLMNFSLNRRTMGELSKGPSRRVRPEPRVQNKREINAMFWRGYIATTASNSPLENVLVHWKYFHHRPCTEAFLMRFSCCYVSPSLTIHFFFFSAVCAYLCLSKKSPSLSGPAVKCNEYKLIRARL